MPSRKGKILITIAAAIVVLFVCCFMHAMTPHEITGVVLRYEDIPQAHPSVRGLELKSEIRYLRVDRYTSVELYTTATVTQRSLDSFMAANDFERIGGHGYQRFVKIDPEVTSLWHKNCWLISNGEFGLSIGFDPDTGRLWTYDRFGSRRLAEEGYKMLREPEQ